MGVKRTYLAAAIALAAVAAVVASSRRGAPAPAPERSSGRADARGPASARWTRAALRGEGAALRGRVLDGGRPVAGAVVLVTSDEAQDAFSRARCPYREDEALFVCPCAPVPELLGSRFVEGRGEAEPVARTTTAADGAFEVGGLPAGTFAVWAEAGPLAAVALEVPAGGAVELALAPGRWFAGTVRDEHDAPIAGADVAAVHRGHSRFFATRTDAGGRFEIGPVPDGAYVVVGAAPGRIPDLAPSPSGETELDLKPARRVEGRVVRDGAPVGGADVRSLRGCSEVATRADAQGRFSLESMEPTSVTVTASSGEDIAMEEVDLEGGDRAGLVLALRPGGAIEGEVRDESGAPVPGVRLNLRCYPFQTEVTAGPDARFRTSSLPPGRYNVTVRAPPGFVERSPRPVQVLEGELTRLDVRLARASVLSGVVLDDATGAPIAGAALVADRAEGDAPLPPDADAPRFARAASDARGRFSFAHAAAGPVTLFIRADGFLETQRPASIPGTLEVRLRRGGTLAVQVLDERGAPVPGTNVIVITARPGIRWPLRLEGRTDGRGRYTFRGMPGGRCRVVAQQPPAVRDSSSVRTVGIDAVVPAPGAAAVELRFEPGRGISGRVLEEGTGRPLAGVLVEAADDVHDPPVEPHTEETHPGSGGAARTGPDGRFEIRHLRPNPHRLSWSLEGYEDSNEGRGVRPGEAGVVLTLRRLPRLTGRVLDDRGAPVTDFTVKSERLHALDGRFEISFEPAEDDEEEPEIVRVQAEGFAPLLREVALGRHDVELGELRLSRGRAVEVTILTAAAGAPVAAARVRVGTAVRNRPGSLDEVLGQGVTGPDGRIRIAALPSLPLSVVVEKDGLARAQAALDEQRSEVTLRLKEGGRMEGTVRNAAGAPVRGIDVSAIGGSGRQSSNTDGEGRFSISGLVPGDYVVVLEQVGGGNFGLSPRSVKLAGDETVQLGFRETTGVKLTLATAAEGYPMLFPGELAPDDATGPETRKRRLGHDVRPDGAFVYRGLPPGVYTAICFGDPDEGRTRFSLLRVIVDRSDLELTLPKPTTPLPEAPQR